MFAVCFTGHRPDKLGGYNENNQTAKDVKSALMAQILKFIEEGFTEFIAGGALGTDTWAAEAVIEARKSHPGVKLTIARPFPSQDSKWFQESKDRFKAFCEAADKVVDVSPDPYTIQKMQTRNEWMVDNADVVLAIWDGSSGGTGNCVRYAKKRSKRIVAINPNTLKIEEY